MKDIIPKAKPKLMALAAPPKPKPTTPRSQGFRQSRASKSKRSRSHAILLWSKFWLSSNKLPMAAAQ